MLNIKNENQVNSLFDLSRQLRNVRTGLIFHTDIMGFTPKIAKRKRRFQLEIFFNNSYGLRFFPSKCCFDVYSSISSHLPMRPALLRETLFQKNCTSYSARCFFRYFEHFKLFLLLLVRGLIYAGMQFSSLFRQSTSCFSKSCLLFEGGCG